MTDLRDRILGGETLIGAFADLASPLSVELLGIAGFDWAVLDLEHGEATEAGLLAMLYAAQTTAMAPVVRVQSAERLRVGITPEGRAPAREGTEILSASGDRIGAINSGGFGPTRNGPIAMGYVAAAYAKSGTPVQLVVRGKPLPAVVCDLPFVPHRYFRKSN